MESGRQNKVKMSIVKDVYSSVASFINEFSKEKCRIECAGLGGSEQAYLISKINMELKAPVLVILDTGINGERFVEDLKFFAKNIAGRVLWFPDYSIMPVKTVSYNNEIEAARIRTLFQLSQNAESPIVVATVYSIMKRLVPRQELTNFAELVIPGEDIDLNVLIEKMISG